MIASKRGVAVAMAIVLTVPLLATATPQKTYAKDKRDIKKIEFCGAPSKYGLINTQYEIEHGKGDSKTNLLKATKLPKAYMNSVSKVNKVYPPTRNQGEYGTCWACSAISLAEINLIKQDLATKKIDYSELQLAYFTYHNATDPLGGIKGDKNGFNFPAGYLMLGGTRECASRILASWKGLVSESDMPYKNCSKYAKGGMDKSYAYNYDKVYLKNAYSMETSIYADGIKNIKNAVYKYGAVGIDYNADHTESLNWVNYNGEQVCTYYCPEYDTSNHAVTIVGWDDNFSRKNFNNNGKKPAKNGAWLVRNSWSTESNNDYYSYFWMSYYDNSMSYLAWAYEMVNASEYDNNYQYDGGMNPWGINTGAEGVDDLIESVSNVYTAKHDEDIKSIMLSNMYTAKDNYSIKIYTDVKDEKNPTSGNLAYEQEGTNEYAGIFTVDLNKLVPIREGQKFAVVVHFESGSYDIEADINEDKYWESYLSDAKPSGHSYYYTKGKWYNTKSMEKKGCGDFCIKALTTNANHNFSDISFKWNKSNSKCTANISCDKKDKTLIKACKVTSEVTREATYYENGVTTYTATVNYAGKTYTDVKSVDNIEKKQLSKVKNVVGTNIKGKKLTISWKRHGKATGYEFQYSTSGKYKKAKTIMLEGRDNISFTTEKLKKNKTYYIRVRAYRTETVDGVVKTVKSNWRPGKKIKIVK